jgi:uncharacterized protein (UPF0333 family)
MAKDKGKKEKKKPKKLKIKQEGFAPLEALLLLVIVSVIGFASWYVISSKNSANNSYNHAASVNTAAKNAAKKSTTKTTPVASPSASPITAALKENAAAAIDSKNTAALEGYMASSVNVVVAGSEHNVNDTAVQAVTELDYFKDSVSPWNFSLDAATLTSYKNGFYGQFFGTNTIVGKSTDGMVVAFGVNGAGKIDKVFMVAQASLLTE